MTQLDETARKIEERRDLMHLLINENEALTDPNLVVLSQELDVLLNEYGKLID